MVRETRKILENANIMVNLAAVGVPVNFAHLAAARVETRTKVTVEDAQLLLHSAPGVIVMDGHGMGTDPIAATGAAYEDAVFVGRRREDLSHPRGLSRWMVSDNLRKGAALNIVQTAEILVNELM